MVLSVAKSHRTNDNCWALPYARPNVAPEHRIADQPPEREKVDAAEAPANVVVQIRY